MRTPWPRLDVILVLAMAAISLLLLSHVSPPGCPALERPAEPQEFATWAPNPPRAASAPCLANLSMAEHPDFSELPAHVRDFLLYRHCRDFALLREPLAAKCARPVFLLLAIKSSPANYGRRQVLRRTWAQERQVHGAPLRRLFLVGSDRDPREARKFSRLLELEARAYGDIVQWDFHDSFFNLTLKQVGEGSGVLQYAQEAHAGKGEDLSDGARGTPLARVSPTPPAGPLPGVAADSLPRRQLCAQWGRRRLCEHGQHGHLPAGPRPGPPPLRGSPDPERGPYSLALEQVLRAQAGDR